MADHTIGGGELPPFNQVVFVADAGHVAQAFRSGEGDPWLTVNEDSEPAPLDFTPTHWGWRRDDLCAEREKGGDCELCGRPVEVGQVVLPYDEPGEMHYSCSDPYALPDPATLARELEADPDMPAPVLLLGRPMLYCPLPEKK